MEMLQEIKTKFDLVKGGRLTDEEAAIYEKSKKEFLERLDQAKEGVVLVKDIFALMDELTAEYLKNNQIACQPGCAWCCYQLVCCTTLEMELIIEYLESLARPLRRSIIQKAKKEALRFLRFYQRNKDEFFGGSLIKRWEIIGGPLWEACLGKPCLYLTKGKRCSIYPVRPVDCRIAKTKDSVCGLKKSLESRRLAELKQEQGRGKFVGESLFVEPKQAGIRLFFEQVASDLVMDEEKRIYGELKRVPLVGWPVSQEFGRFFF